MRRGIAELDGRGEVVGGIVIMRHGENALRVIDRVKHRLAEVGRSLPPGVQIVVTYDRSELILGSIHTLARALVEEHGPFIEIHVRTSLDECAKRDVNGLYAKAFAGEIKGFTGVDDPYEAPEAAEIVVDTEGLSPEESAAQVVDKLEELGLVPAKVTA